MAGRFPPASHFFKTALFCLLFVAFLPGSVARADVGIPPWSVPGSSTSPGDRDTHVQMIREDVTLVIEAHTDESILPIHGGDLAANHMVGHVEAVFQMRNQGTEPEAFDVWFPLWIPDYDPFEIVNARHFAVWVDDNPVDFSTYFEPVDGQPPIEMPKPWATWFVNFPPGQDVEISVIYDIRPTGNQPYGTFHYILETGADWWGPIGEGTITYQLPYKVNEINTALNPNSHGMYGSTVPNPAPNTISDDLVIWHFDDLEPTTADNIQLTVMDPLVWKEIEEAQKAADAVPDSFDAQLRLAYALSDGLEIYKIIHNQASSMDLERQAIDAFQRAFDLSPDQATIEDVTAYLTLYYYYEAQERAWVEVIYPPDNAAWLLVKKMQTLSDIPPVFEYLRMIYWPIDNYFNDYDYSSDGSYDDYLDGLAPPPDSFLAVVARANELDPEKSGGFEYWQTELENRSIRMPPTATPLPTPEPTLPPPTAAPTAHPPSPTPTTPEAGGRACPGASLLIFGSIGMAFWWNTQRRDRIRS